VDGVVKKFTWIDWLLLAIILFGLGYGVYSWIRRSAGQLSQQGVGKSAGSALSATAAYQKEIYVDVSGEVEKAGVYKLENGARMKDALAAAGGLSSKADREFVAQSINLAEKLIDGQKVFIPGYEQVKGVQTSKININKADLTSLETLSGVGAVRAQAIVDNRPYQSIEDLVKKKVLSASVYEKIKDKISVY
jgi:competence protein ComEA